MPHRLLLPTAALAFLAVPAPHAAAADGRPESSGPAPLRLDAVQVPGATAIRLDGNLSEETWQQASAVSDFVQREPHEGAPPSFKTEARVAYDASHLYVAIRAFDPEPGKIVGHLTRRDADSPSDWIRVLVDSYHDRRTAYEFGVNPVGVKEDKYWFNDGNQSDESWDAVWDVVVARDQEGWKAEFRIPFSQLRFNPGSGTTFGFAISRYVGRLNETSTWPLLARSASGYVSSFGELGGLAMSGSPKRLELVPYSLAELKTREAEEGNPFVKPEDPGASVGLDLKYALTPGLTLTSTINPDFGQVEADPAVVNLSAFETFFAERRPFFIEGSSVFRFDIDCNDGQCTGLFYSRRIGRAPQGLDELPSDDGTYTLAPVQTTILGAAKVTGRIGGFSIGAMNALTQEETAQVATGTTRSGQAIEPFTSYSILRARKEFANQSSLGFMTTATNRRLTDSVRFLPASAYTGGIDWDWRLGRRHSLSGFWAGSTVRGDTEAIVRLQENNRHSFQRPDADHLDLDPTRTALNGHAGMLSFSKIGGERMRFNTNVAFKSPGFDINDVGFFRRADQRTMGNWLQLRRDTPSRYLRSFRINFNQWGGWNFDGDKLFLGGNINAHATFVNNWRTGAGVNVNQDGFDDRLTRGGPGGLTEGFRTLWGYVEGDNRRPVSFGSFFAGGRDGHDSWFGNVEPSVTLRPKSSLSLTGGLRVGKEVQDAQWIEEVSDERTHYVFGHLEQVTVAMTARVNYTLTPTLSIQLYAEPFVSAGDYDRFKELVEGRAPEYEDRYAPFAYTGDPDFNYKSFRTTNVLRWEYRPGSALFVVWQQGREDSTSPGDFRLGRDFGDMFRIHGRNVFLVKLAYWLNY